MNITEQRVLALQYQHFCQQKQQNNPCHSLELLIKLCVYLCFHISFRHFINFPANRLLSAICIIYTHIDTIARLSYLLTQGASEEEQRQYQVASNYLNGRQYQQALNVLSGMKNRGAHWYYLSAIANMGLGNALLIVDAAQGIHDKFE